MIHYIHKTAQDAHPGEDAPVSERHKQTRHLPKDQPAADRAMSHELVMRASDNVLMVQQSSTRLRGYGSVFGILLLVAAPLGLATVQLLLSVGFPITSLSHLFGVVIALTVFVVTVGSIFLALRTFRIDRFAALDTLPLSIPDSPGISLQGYLAHVRDEAGCG